MNKTIELIGSSDVQNQLVEHINSKRKQLKLSRASLAVRSGVPASTIKKFETTHQISFRQFILLWQSVDSLDKLLGLIHDDVFVPKTIEDIINHE